MLKHLDNLCETESVSRITGDCCVIMKSRKRCLFRNHLIIATVSLVATLLLSLLLQVLFIRNDFIHRATATHFVPRSETSTLEAKSRTSKMPGPGPHLMYTLGSGVALMSISDGLFSPHHCLVYSINAFFGPDIGSFSEWLTSTVGLGSNLGSAIESVIHHPFYYIFILGFPFSLLYNWVSRILLHKGILDSASRVPLTRWQCFLLLSGGSLSHFFLDHLFEENGQSSMYKWILSTGWWEGRAPVNLDAVIVISFLCICLIFGFIYINRVKSPKSLGKKSLQSVTLLLIIASLYSLWCASQIYLVSPRRSAVGEEADLGVLLFLVCYFFLPHGLCIMSMNSRDALESVNFPL